MNAMTDFFSSLKADLLDRRLLPFLVVLGVVLVAAVAYAVLGGGSSSAPTPVTASVPAGASAAVGDVAVSQAPANPNQPISETTEGTSKQHHGVAHNPFTPLPEAKKAAASSTSSSSSAVHHALRRVDAICPELRRHDADDAQGNNAREAQGVRALPRDRAARCRAGRGRRRPGTPALLRPIRTWRSTNRCPARPTRSSCSSAWCCAPARSAVQARRRGDPARQRQLPAERDPVPGDRPAGRPERDARSRRSRRQHRHLRTEARQHRQEH